MPLLQCSKNVSPVPDMHVFFFFGLCQATFRVALVPTKSRLQYKSLA